jgi:alginate O-acetyltransferase complex protein AlgI
MLFNSYPFLLAFYPVTVALFFLIARFSHPLAAAWLALASLCFYAYWSIAAVPLLVVSICLNYGFGLALTPGSAPDAARRRRLYAAVAINLAVLGYFKYANFFIGNLNWALDSARLPPLRALNVVLPIGISFFTFTQIAFLVDCYEGKVLERKFVHYLLFVSYFPHLIAGPVLHHGQMMPQFRRPETYRMRYDNVLAGLFNVAVGLAKKVLLADEFSQYASPVFDAARDGHPIGAIAAWTAALAYTLQIYFDFSGYSDMAIGLSRILGIDLPLNFDSPYKAASIIDFWRRWHMSLSRFLRDYLYVRLGGNRLGAARRHANLMATMLLGGLWHGASWTFVVWGGLHGTYLLVNHAWRSVLPRLPPPGKALASCGRLAGFALTFFCVVVAWIFFRSTTFDGAARMLGAMFRFEVHGCGPDCFDQVFRGIAVPPTSFGYLAGFLAIGFAIVWLTPTTQSSTRQLREAGHSAAWLAAGALVFLISSLAVVNASHQSSEFIYFNF